ncbi:MAG: hypothetical protein ACP5JO_05780, partial [Candidatus Ratteibacteria bacterium]
GGCLLTDRIYAEKLKKLLNSWSDCTLDDVEIIKHGRMFWYGDVLIVLGRNKQDNEILKSIARHGDVAVRLKSIPGPLAIARGRKIGGEAIEYAKNMVLHYTKKIGGKNIEFLIEEIK